MTDKKICIYLDDDTLEKIRRLRCETGLSMSGIVRMAVLAYLTGK